MAEYRLFLNLQPNLPQVIRNEKLHSLCSKSGRPTPQSQAEQMAQMEKSPPQAKIKTKVSFQ